MSRTYRRKDRKFKAHVRGRSGHFHAQKSERPPMYKNAIRIRCVAAVAEKWLFHSKEAAIEAAKYNWHQRLERDGEDRRERVYYCRTCGGWHLTKMSKEQWREKKAKVAEYLGTELDENDNFKDMPNKPKKYLGY